MWSRGGGIVDAISQLHSLTCVFGEQTAQANENACSQQLLA
jgi:hypothetical protein